MVIHLLSCKRRAGREREGVGVVIHDLLVIGHRPYQSGLKHTNRSGTSQSGPGAHTAAGREHSDTWEGQVHIDRLEMYPLGWEYGSNLEG